MMHLSYPSLTPKGLYGNRLMKKWREAKKIKMHTVAGKSDFCDRISTTWCLRENQIGFSTSCQMTMRQREAQSQVSPLSVACNTVP